MQVIKNIPIELTQKQKDELFEALFFLKISELKSLCNKFNIHPKGEKITLIENIKYYINTGNKPKIKIIPESSKAKPKTNYTLEPNALILYGSFKNDLRTRNFFKKLIGDHFHYTAYGLDWIKDRWYNGNPPTYLEFANYWQEEYLSRKKIKGKLKPEWAYLNFLDNYKKEHPNLSKEEAINSWKKYRQLQVNKIKTILNIEI